MIFKKKRNILFIIAFISFNILSTILISFFQVYQRYIDLNSSIVNGVDLAIKNGVLLSDIRGSLKDIADSYLSGKVMTSSRLTSLLNNVDIIRKDIDVCSKKKCNF